MTLSMCPAQVTEFVGARSRYTLPTNAYNEVNNLKQFKSAALLAAQSASAAPNNSKRSMQVLKIGLVAACGMPRLAMAMRDGVAAGCGAANKESFTSLVSDETIQQAPHIFDAVACIADKALVSSSMSASCRATAAAMRAGPGGARMFGRWSDLHPGSSVAEPAVDDSLTAVDSFVAFCTVDVGDEQSEQHLANMAKALAGGHLVVRKRVPGHDITEVALDMVLAQICVSSFVEWCGQPLQ
jgi:hypothetical protein